MGASASGRRRGFHPRNGRSIRSAPAKVMKQVFLSRRTARQVVWIPAQLATKGRYLRIRDVDGWKVEEVYASAPSMLTSDGRCMRHLFGSI